MNAIDTNVWIYSHDTRDAHKQAVAQGLIANLRSLALPWQIGCEFIAASRKLAPLGFDAVHAWTALGDMQSMANAGRLPKAFTLATRCHSGMLCSSQLASTGVSLSSTPRTWDHPVRLMGCS